MSGNDKPNKQIQYMASIQNMALMMKKYKRKTFLISVFAIICLVLIAYLATHQRVYLMPYGAKNKILTNSPQYLVKLARLDAETYFNLTPRIVKAQAGIFLTRVVPSLYGETQNAMELRVNNYIKDNKSSVFYPDNDAQVLGHNVTLTGNLITWIGKDRVGNKTITLHVNYDIDGGLAYISRWNYE